MLVVFQVFMELFTLIFFTFTLYSRCFEFTVPIFLALNNHKWFTKFAQITQEQIMYVQATNIVLAVCGRLVVICFANTKKQLVLRRLYMILPWWLLYKLFRFQIIERLSKFTIFFLQVTLPTLIVIPFYFVYNFSYGLKGITTPLLLSTTDKSYDKVYLLK